jgi:hypothetical protein
VAVPSLSVSVITLMTLCDKHGMYHCNSIHRLLQAAHSKPPTLLQPTWPTSTSLEIAATGRMRKLPGEVNLGRVAVMVCQDFVNGLNFCMSGGLKQQQPQRKGAGPIHFCIPALKTQPDSKWESGSNSQSCCCTTYPVERAGLPAGTVI